MSRTEETRAVFNAFITEMFSGGPGFQGDLVADDYIQHQPGIGQGKKGVIEFFAANAGAIEDVRSWTENLVIDGDKASCWMCMEGTHVGSFFGIPATGKRITIKTADTFRIANGQIVEHWAIWDPTDYLEQMGALTDDMPPLPWPPRYG
jgi:predicted SnoaL-like aldol condensation-catalyzing enzyme